MNMLDSFNKLVGGAVGNLVHPQHAQPTNQNTQDTIQALGHYGVGNAVFQAPQGGRQIPLPASAQIPSGVRGQINRATGFTPFQLLMKAEDQMGRNQAVVGKINQATGFNPHIPQQMFPAPTSGGLQVQPTYPNQREGMNPQSSYIQAQQQFLGNPQLWQGGRSLQGRPVQPDIYEGNVGNGQIQGSYNF